MFGSLWAGKKWAERIALLRLSGQQPDDGVNRQSTQVKFLRDAACVPMMTKPRQQKWPVRFTWRDGSDRQGFESAASIINDEAETECIPSKR